MGLKNQEFRQKSGHRKSILILQFGENSLINESSIDGLVQVYVAWIDSAKTDQKKITCAITFSFRRLSFLFRPLSPHIKNNNVGCILFTRNVFIEITAVIPRKTSFCTKWLSNENNTGRQGRT